MTFSFNVLVVISSMYYRPFFNFTARSKSSNDKSASPSCLYDFKSESPETASKPKQEKQKSSRQQKSRAKSKPKPLTGNEKKSHKKGVQSMANMTPQLQPVIHLGDSARVVRGKRHLRNVKPLPPPNLDDISPIVCHLEAKIKKSPKNNVEVKQLRSSPRLVVTPAVSFLESTDSSVDKDDSGLFVSPRKTMPVFSTGKTSTPASLPQRGSKKVGKKVAAKNVAKTDTSTPVEINTCKNFTKIKGPLEVSPVQRMETPTSDYGSMQSFDIASPFPVRKGKKKRSSSPAFTLEEDSGKVLL